VSVPAVVVGAGINGLGVVRSLGRAGIPTWLIESDRSDPALRTRHAKTVATDSLSGAGVVDALLALRARFTADPVLFLTREETVEAVSLDLDRLTACYRLSMPGAALMRQLMDKTGFQMLAEEHGFPIPRAVHLRDAGDLHLSETLEYPCVLKPTVKTPSYAARFKKAYKVDSPAELREIFLGVDGTAEMVAQEWIEGGDDRIYFCLQYRRRGESGVARASFTGRKLRSWPPQTGGTASCVPADDAAEELEGLTNAFFSAVGYFGIGSIEFKQHARTGRFLMIEPTVGRTDFQEEIATLNGVNIPYAAYCGELGSDFAASRRAVPPAGWADAAADRQSSQAQPHLRHSFPAGVRRYDALWRLDDPLPWCYATAERVKARLLR
jgi:predicted ATP-grasp superfamily ATP-dependent carboligase